MKEESSHAEERDRSLLSKFGHVSTVDVPIALSLRQLLCDVSDVVLCLSNGPASWRFLAPEAV